MQVWITKYKDSTGRVPNYFQPFNIVYVDHIIFDDRHLTEDAFSDFTDELEEKDSPGTFTTADYTFKQCILVPVLSAQGKTIEEFFDPATDMNVPVGYKFAYGENKTSCERGDFIVPESIKINKVQNDSGYMLSFTVTGAEEMYIRRSEVLPAETITTAAPSTYRSVLSQLLCDTRTFARISYTDTTFPRFQAAGFNPVIFHPIWNRCVENFNDRTRWNLFLKFGKEHGFAYGVEHPAAINPAVLDSYKFKTFFLTDSADDQSFKVIEDEDYIISHNLSYAKQHFAIFYVSYTSPLLPSQDWLGTLYISQNENTIGFTDLNGQGLVLGNQTNNVFKNYKLGKYYLRNSYAINEDDMILFGGDRVSYGTIDGVNIGVSIGRSLVGRFESITIPNIGTIYTDYDFNNIVKLTAGREYPRLAAGVKQGIECTVAYEAGNAPRRFARFPENGKTWRIHRITNKKDFSGTCKLFGVSI